MDQPTPPPDEATRQANAAVWRWLTILGSLLVISAFTLGIIEEYNWFLPGIMGTLSVPFLIGIGGRALATQINRPQMAETCGQQLTAILTFSCSLLIISTLLGGALFFLEVGVKAMLIWVAVGAGFSAMLFRSVSAGKKLGHRQQAHSAFLCAALLLACAGLSIAVSLFASPWLWILSLGAAIQLFGTIGEARSITQQSWLDTVWLLFSDRLKDADIPPGSCPGCRYHLFGLREQRCPECGRPFTFEELGMTPEAMGFESLPTCEQEEIQTDG